MVDKRKAAVLTRHQLAHLLRVTAATSQLPDRDVLILLLGHGCGMRVSEIAQLTIADVMFASGKLRSEVSLRAAITKGCRQRCVYLSAPAVVSALESYLKYRLQSGQGFSDDQSRFRGLNPRLPLILTRSGRTHSMNTKRRVLKSGDREDYAAADALQVHVTKLYAGAGIRGGSSHSGRRSFATHLNNRLVPIEKIQQLMGHADIDQTGDYIEPNRSRLRRAFVDVL